MSLVGSSHFTLLTFIFAEKQSLCSGRPEHVYTRRGLVGRAGTGSGHQLLLEGERQTSRLQRERERSRDLSAAEDTPRLTQWVVVMTQQHGVSLLLCNRLFEHVEAFFWYFLLIKFRNLAQSETSCWLRMSLKPLWFIVFLP